MNTLSRALVLTLAVAAFSTLAACATSANSSIPSEVEEDAIVHTVTDEDRAVAASKEPIAADSAILWVNGLGCPQCATNIDLQLERVIGVKSTNVDLSNGKVTVGLAGNNRPSPARLGKAVHDAGFTLVKVETN